jgi:hypothetical protein
VSACSEPEGDEVVDTEHGVDRAHDVMIELTGQCPWCGVTEEDERGEPSP